VSTTTVYITRDAALEQSTDFDGLAGYFVTSDAGAFFEPRFQVDADRFLAVGVNGASAGLVVLVTRTGAKITRNQLRVRIDFPRDTGDWAGTLAFGEAESVHTGGLARREFYRR
jgi:hypothetical protein